jgi:dTDP-4-amino-4,6-dideoxygalactose transaminase
MERGLHADLPVTDAASARTIALPMHPNLTPDEQATVIAAVRGALGRRAAGAADAAANGATVESAAR